MGNLISIKKNIIQSDNICLLIDVINQKEQERIINLSKLQLENKEYTKNDIIINLHNYIELYDLKSRNKFLLLKDYILELEKS